VAPLDKELLKGEPTQGNSQALAQFQQSSHLVVMNSGGDFDKGDASTQRKKE
jgi:hypothetical protein